MTRRVLSLTILWLLLAGCLTLREIGDLDIYSQIALGLEALRTGTFVRYEPFVVLRLGEPIPNPGWLAQIILAGFYKFGGMALVELLHCLMWALGFVLCAAGALLQRPDLRLRSVILAAMLAVICAVPFAAVRPQSFAVLALGILVLLSARSRSFICLTILAVPLLFVWQNTHPSLGVGAAWFGLSAAGILVASWMRNRDAERGLLGQHVGLAGLCCLLQLATPEGMSIVLLSQQNLNISRDVLGVSEWMPALHDSVRAATLPVLALMLLLVTLAARVAQEAAIPAILVAAGFSALTFYAARFGLFFAMASIPLTAVVFERLFRSSNRDGAAEETVSLARAVPLIAIFSIGLAVLMRWQPLPQTGKDYPTGCVEKLESAVPAGSRVYNYLQWAGPLSLAGYKPVIDGRLYLYSDADLLRYKNEVRGSVKIEEIYAHYDIHAFLLHNLLHRELVRQLDDHAQWQILTGNENCSVYVPRYTAGISSSAAP